LEIRGSGLILRYYPGIRLEGLRKTTRNIQHNRSPDQDLKPEPPEAGVLTTAFSAREVGAILKDKN
jgi:hypothetical protein